MDSQLYTHGRRNGRGMLVIVGIIVVFGAIVGGYLLEKGNLLVLFQPAELLIIGGAALGTMLIANPMHILKQIASGIVAVLKGSGYDKSAYTETLRMLYDLFSNIRKAGVTSIEQDIEAPEQSQFFGKYPQFTKNHHGLHFLCDTLRTHLSGAISHYDLDRLMDVDLEVHHEESTKPVSALTSVADSLPGLGIVAAVLGVVVTMASLGGPPEEIGHKVAAALVGTFLGILLCYGLVGPLSANIAKIKEAEAQYYRCIKEGLMSFVKGAAPILAVEFARRSIPAHVRPSFHEMEAVCRNGSAEQ